MSDDERPRGVLPSWLSVPVAPEHDDAVAPEPEPSLEVEPAPAPVAASTPVVEPEPEPEPELEPTPVPVPAATAAPAQAPVTTPVVPAPSLEQPVVSHPAARGLWATAAGLVVLIVALAVATVVLRGKDADQRDRADRLIALAAVQDPQGPALRAAATAVETLLSYDYATIDADFAAGQKLLTPGFAAKYGDFTSKLVRPSALQARAKVVATLQVLAPTEATLADRVVVLAFVDQQTTSALLKAPAVDQSRITLTLIPRNGTWLVCDLVVTGSKPGENPGSGCAP